MKRDALKAERLVDDALRLGIGAVVRRVGYLLEHDGMADAGVIEPLRAELTATYQRLDLLLSRQDYFCKRVEELGAKGLSMRTVPTVSPVLMSSVKRKPQPAVCALATTMAS